MFSINIVNRYGWGVLNRLLGINTPKQAGSTNAASQQADLTNLIVRLRRQEGKQEALPAELESLCHYLRQEIRDNRQGLAMDFVAEYVDTNRIYDYLEFRAFREVSDETLVKYYVSGQQDAKQLEVYKRCRLRLIQKLAARKKSQFKDSHVHVLRRHLAEDAKLWPDTVNSPQLKHVIDEIAQQATAALAGFDQQEMRSTELAGRVEELKQATIDEGKAHDRTQIALETAMASVGALERKLANTQSSLKRVTDERNRAIELATSRKTEIEALKQELQLKNAQLGLGSSSDSDVREARAQSPTRFPSAGALFSPISVSGVGAGSGPSSVVGTVDPRAHLRAGNGDPVAMMAARNNVLAMF